MSRSLEKIIWQRAIKILEKGWTRKGHACTRDGKDMSPISPAAVRFCPYGPFVCAAAEMMPEKSLVQLWRYADRVIDDAVEVEYRNSIGTKAQALSMMRRRMMCS